MLESGEESKTISADGVIHVFNLSSLRTDLMSNLDKLKGNSFLVFCKVFRDDTDYGLLMESIASLLYFIGFKQRKIEAVILLVTAHLVNDNLEECLLLLREYATLTQIPLLKRLLIQMADEVRVYMGASSAEEKKSRIKELTTAYMKIWYYFKTL